VTFSLQPSRRARVDFDLASEGFRRRCLGLAEKRSGWTSWKNLSVFRTEILRQLRVGRKSFLITSCWEREGKSFVAANLGAALAVMGRSVVLVDCDLRRPTL